MLNFVRGQVYDPVLLTGEGENFNHRNPAVAGFDIARIKI